MQPRSVIFERLFVSNFIFLLHIGTKTCGLRARAVFEWSLKESFTVHGKWILMPYTCILILCWHSLHGWANTSSFLDHLVVSLVKEQGRKLISSYIDCNSSSIICCPLTRLSLIAYWHIKLLIETQCDMEMNKKKS